MSWPHIPMWARLSLKRYQRSDWTQLRSCANMRLSDGLALAPTGIGAFPFAEPSLQSPQMSSIKLLAICILLLGCPACDLQQQPQHPPKPAYQQRFVPVHREPSNLTGLPWSGAFALDTKTGQLCWTYEIVNNTQNDAWPNIPDCENLYHQYPD